MKDGNYLAAIQLNDQSINALAKQGLTFTDIPEAGRVVKVKYIPSGANGGTRVDCTDRIHPDNAAIACQACRALGIDLGGLDFLAPDISKSVWETGGGIVEINSAPGLYPHYQPTAGPPRDPVPAILEMLFPTGSPVRVPVIAIAGTSELDQISAAIGDLVGRNGAVAGRNLTDGAMIGSMKSSTRSFGPSPVHAALYNPEVELAILTVADDDLNYPGLEFNEIDVAVISGAAALDDDTRLSADRVVIQLVERGGTVVTNETDYSAISSLLPDGVQALLVSVEGETEFIRAHVAGGGKAVVSSGDGSLLLLGPDQERIEIAVDTASPQESTLLAIGAAFAYGVPPEMIGIAGS